MDLDKKFVNFVFKPVKKHFTIPFSNKISSVILCFKINQIFLTMFRYQVCSRFNTKTQDFSSYCHMENNVTGGGHEIRVLRKIK